MKFMNRKGVHGAAGSSVVAARAGRGALRVLGLMGVVAACAGVAQAWSFAPPAAEASQAAQAQATMRAVRQTGFGGPEVLKLETIDRPAPGAGEVLVKVAAAGVNPVDWKIRQGGLKGMTPATPFTPGYDIAGVIEAVGSGVKSVKAGDEVFAYLPLSKGGGYAEFALVAEAHVARKPASISMQQAAGVPLAGLTAWQALIDKARLQAGQTVLIHAGAGGVGHFAVQIAKAHGAKVIATASESNLAFLKELGADVVVDYRSQKFEDVAKDVDVVLDPIGGETQDRSIGTLKAGGVLVSIVQPPNPERLKARGVRGLVFLVQPDGSELGLIGKMIDEGRIKPHVSGVFPLAEVAKAHEASQGGRTRGKIVLDVTGR
jgi:NADPH:quinone reductase-like Zn-dependent oxidoreductase